jgi:hypothetical protein
MKMKTASTATTDICQCTVCLRFFADEASFDEHRFGSFKNGTRHCMSIARMLQLGFVYTSDIWTQQARPSLGRVINADRRRPVAAS